MSLFWIGLLLLRAPAAAAEEDHSLTVLGSQCVRVRPEVMPRTAEWEVSELRHRAQHAATATRARRLSRRADQVLTGHSNNRRGIDGRDLSVRSLSHVEKIEIHVSLLGGPGCPTGEQLVTVEVFGEAPLEEDDAPRFEASYRVLAPPYSGQTSGVFAQLPFQAIYQAGTSLRLTDADPKFKPLWVRVTTVDAAVEEGEGGERRSALMLVSVALNPRHEIQWALNTGIYSGGLSLGGGGWEQDFAAASPLSVYYRWTPWDFVRGIGLGASLTLGQVEFLGSAVSDLGVDDVAEKAFSLEAGVSLVVRSDNLGTHDVFFYTGADAGLDGGELDWRAPVVGVAFVTRIADLSR